MLNVNDLPTIFQYYWVLDISIFFHKRKKIQLILILLITAFITIYLDVIIKKVYIKNSNKVFCYKDNQLILLQNSKVENCKVFVMEITLYHIKKDLS